MRFFSPTGWFLSGLLCVILLPGRSAAQNWQWVAPSSAATAGSVSIAASALNGAGELVVVGSFTGTVQLGFFSLTSTGSSDVFVGFLSPAGVWLRVNHAGGAGADRATGVAVDAGGQVVVTGTFASPSLGFDATAVANSDATGATSDIFVAWLDAASGWQRALAAGGPGNDDAAAVACSRTGTTTVVGTFAGVAFTAGGQTLTNAAPAGGSLDLFVAQAEAPTPGSAAYSWVQALRGGGPGDDVATTVTVDANGRTLIGGYFFSPAATFGATMLTNADPDGLNADAFVFQLLPASAWRLLAQLSNPGSEYVQALKLDAASNAVVAGHFTAPTVVLGSTTLANADNAGLTSDLFVARLNAAGQWTQAVRAGTAENEYATGLSVDATGNAVVTGTFAGASLPLGALSLPNANTTAGNPSSDVFVARLNTAGTWTHAAPAGGAGDDYATAVVCDAQGATYVGGVAGLQSARFGTLTATPATGFVARLNGFPAMPSATKPSLATTHLQLYPNPASAGRCTLAYDLPAAATVSLTVLDALGRPVLTVVPPQRQVAGPHALPVPAQGLAAGLYTVRLVCDGAAAFVKLVVE